MNVRRIGGTLSRFYRSPVFPWVLVGLGALVRIVQYAYNRSLWFDEASLSLNVIGHSFSELLMEPLPYNQAAPPGVLLLQRLSVVLFGSGERALRLFPLLCALVALGVLPVVARYFTGRKGVPLAVALFAMSPHLIYFSTEAKQYSVDVLAVLVMAWVAIRYGIKPRDHKRLAVLIGAGVLAVWFSYPVLFVMAGSGTGLLVDAVRQRDARAVARIAGVGLAWLVSFMLLFKVHLSMTMNYAVGWNWWKPDAFIQFPPDRVWLSRTFKRIFLSSREAVLPVLALGVVVCGLVGFLRRRSGRIRLGWLLSFVPFLLVVSAMKRYPFFGRLLLFSMPAWIFLVGRGILLLSRILRSWRLPALAVACIVVFMNPFSLSQWTMHKRQEIRPLIRTLATDARAGDTLWVEHDSHRAYTYYAGRITLPDLRIVRDPDRMEGYLDSLMDLRGINRVWMLFSLSDLKQGKRREKRIVQHARTYGKEQLRIVEHGAALYLFDFSDREKGNLTLIDQ